MTRIEPAPAASHYGPETASNYVTLRQVLEVVDCVDDACFVQAGEAFPDSSIGQHIRHICDFYEAFLTGAEAGWIDYDARHRDPSVERSRSAARQRLDDQLRALLELSMDRDAAVQVSSISVPGLPHSAAAEPCVSTPRRELVFLQGHATHHLAMIVLMMNALGLPTEPEWGVAPSTLEWRRHHSG